VVKIRWFWWLLAAVPAFVGFVSLSFGVGDFRSSGLVVGVGLSLGLVAVLLLLRRPWRGRKGVSRWLSAVPGLLLGLVGLLGLAAGLPEFLEARGLFIDVDNVGPRAVVSFDDGYVLVGDDSNGGFVWFSVDGVTWSHVDDPIFDDLDELRDVIAVEGGLIAVGSDGRGEAVILVSADGLVWSEAGRFGNVEDGTVARAISQTGNGFDVITSTIGNDVEFYRSADISSWTVVEPAGVFDDGESGSDIACGAELCVGVGSHDASYRSDDIASNIFGTGDETGVAWVDTIGDRYTLVNNDFQAEQLTEVAAAAIGFVAVGNNHDGHGVAWLSSDGQNWTKITGPFNDMVIDGITSTDTNYTIFGRDAEMGDIIAWTTNDTEQWGEETVSADSPEGSNIRAMTGSDGTRLAVGISSDTLHTIIWTSTNGQNWRHTATLETQPTSQRSRHNRHYLRFVEPV